MTSYCEYVRTHPEDEFNRRYHDTQYGFPLTEDHLLFERLILEINQAGLSWLTILKKQENFIKAYQEFDIDRIAAYDKADRNRLMNDPGIIRNRLKINAAIENARTIQSLCSDYGSFKGWLDAHHPRSLENWTLLFKQTFKFTGKEIVKEFLISTGYLPGAHTSECPVFEKTVKLRPAWFTG